MSKKIYIGAAHDAQNQGVGEGDLREYSISLDVHQGIVEILKANNVPHQILLETLSARISTVKAASDVLLFLEPHCNNLPENTKARGYFIMVQSGNTAAEKYAKTLLEAFSTLPIPKVKKGICYHKDGKCWFEDGPTWIRNKIAALENISAPVLIIEMCYLSNEMDKLWISNKEHRLLFGNAIGRGLVNIWGAASVGRGPIY